MEIKKRIFTIALTCCAIGNIYGQNDKEEKLFSNRVQQGQISGFLVGKYGPPESYKYFEFLDLLDAEVYLITSNKPIKIICNIEPFGKTIKTYFIKLTLTKDVIKAIGNEQNLKFTFTFFIKGDINRVVKGGSFRTTTVERKLNTAKPKSSIDYDPGFIVSAPAELSIYLIEREVNYFLRIKDDYKTNRETKISNFILQPGISSDSLSSLQFRLATPFTDTNYSRLSDLMYTFRYCDSYLKLNSFFNSEGNELRSEIDSISSEIREIQFDTSKTSRNYLDSLTVSLYSKRDALKVYESTKVKLEFTRQRIIKIIKESYYDFDRIDR